jgi:hypothetical protein
MRQRFFKHLMFGHDRSLNQRDDPVDVAGRGIER